jgi:hypothetical protein
MLRTMWRDVPIERKRGRPRAYCFVCEPPGWQVVKVLYQSRLRLRRRRPVFLHLRVTRAGPSAGLLGLLRGNGGVLGCADTSPRDFPRKSVLTAPVILALIKIRAANQLLTKVGSE